MTRLRIHLLGGFLIDVEGRTLPPIPSAVGRSLFAYLVTHRDLRHTRDLLAGTFWPERSESSARKRLSQTLWQIQTALHEEPSSGSLLAVSHGTVAFDSSADFWLDVAQFDKHLSNAERLAGNELDELNELEAGVDLYRGEFLAGFYEDWTDLERERLRSRYLVALERLVTLRKGGADYDTALSFARRLTLHDPMREDAHREVMRLCFLLGRPNEALHQYERCAAILAEELGTVPTAETTELRDHVAQLRDKGEHPFAPTAQSPLLDVERQIPLVGRREQREVALRRLEDTLSGRGGVLLIEGNAGIGKTRLFQELAEDASWRGLSLLWANCSEEAMLHPLGTLRTAIESGMTPLRVEQLGEMLDEVELADLARVAPIVRSWLPDLPEPAPLRPAEEQDRLTQSVRRLLEAMSTLNATVLFVDDAQWSDLESLAALIDMASELQDVGLLLCLSFRSEEARERADLWQLIMQLDRTARPERLVLGTLTQSESTTLVEESLAAGAVAPHVAEGLYHETGGNPLFILETLRAWHEETQGLATLAEMEPGAAVAGGIAQVIARRLSGLDADTRRVLEAGAVSATAGDADVLARATGLPRLGVLQAFDDLLRRGVLVEADDGYDFTHYQMRRVILDGLDPDDRRRLHYDTALALELRQPDRLEELAYHYTEAGARDQAIRFSIAAGNKALGLAAYETAAQHFENAASWGAGFDVLVEWEDTLDVLGRRDEQGKVIDQMESLAFSVPERIETSRRRARLLGHEGRHQEAITLAEGTLDLGGPDAATGALRRTLGLLLSRSGSTRAAVSHLGEAVEILADYPAAEAGARCDLGNVLVALQRYDQAKTELELALAAYERLGDLRGVTEAAGELAVLQMEQGDVAGAIERYEQTLALSRDIGYRRREGVTLLNLGNALYVDGRLGDALCRYDEAAGVFGSIGDPEGEALVRANSAGVRHMILGDPTAEDDLLVSLAFFRDSGHPWGEAFCLEHFAAIARRRGEFDAARRHVEEGLLLLTGGKHRWVEVHLLRQGAQVELDAHRPAQASPLIEQARRICDDLGLEDVAPTIESLAAAVALMGGNVEESLALARTATELLTDDVEQPYLVWHARYRAATAVGEMDEAHESLRVASRLLDAVIDSLDTESAALSLDVPEHRLINDDRVRTWPTLVIARLPRADVPLGRPLRDADWADVTWTATKPEDYELDDRADRRRTQIGRLVDEAKAQFASPRVEDLAWALGVSAVTVRRDISWLRRHGHPLDTRGSR